MATDGTAESASAVSAAPDFAAFELAENKLAIGGEAPAPATVPTPAADPDGDEHDETEPTTTASSAVEAKAPVPTPEKPISKRQQQINDLIRSRAESDQRAAKLEAEIAELKSKATPPKEEPKPAEKPPVVDATDPEPREEDFESYGQFTYAAAKWAVRQARREEKAAADEAEAAAKKTAEEAEFTTRTETWAQRRDAFAAKTPEFAEKAGPFLNQVRAGTVIGDAILDSEVGPELSLYLATHPDEVSRIVQLSPASALRALGKLEAKFEPMTSASASAGPAARTVTKAPAPPTTLSARSADPADPVAAALERGDFRAFEEAENRKALASR